MQETATIATVGFSDLHYHELQPLQVGPVNELSRERLIKHALEEREVGQVLLYNKSDDYHSTISDAKTCL
jgi:hypothetical protein